MVNHDLMWLRRKSFVDAESQIQSVSAVRMRDEEVGALELLGEESDGSTELTVVAPGGRSQKSSNKWLVVSGEW